MKPDGVDENRDVGDLCDGSVQELKRHGVSRVLDPRDAVEEKRQERHRDALNGYTDE